MAAAGSAEGLTGQRLCIANVYQLQCLPNCCTISNERTNRSDESVSQLNINQRRAVLDDILFIVIDDATALNTYMYISFYKNKQCSES